MRIAMFLFASLVGFVAPVQAASTVMNEVALKCSADPGCTDSLSADGGRRFVFKRSGAVLVVSCAEDGSCVRRVPRHSPLPLLETQQLFGK